MFEQDDIKSQSLVTPGNSAEGAGAPDVHAPTPAEGPGDAGPHEQTLSESAAGRESAAATATAGTSASIAENGIAAHVESSPAPAEEEDDDRGPIEEILPSDEPPKLQWYILKVQSNREDSIRDALQRRVAIAGLQKFFSEILVPIEMVTEFKGGKKRVVKRKLYPGYLVVNMEINEDTWFLVRETPGIGDFTGSAGKPSPMTPSEVARVVLKQEEKSDESPKLKINFSTGDRVKINEGTFENFEGSVDAIDQASGRVTVMINIFGRSTPVELEYWQVESL